MNSTPVNGVSYLNEILQKRRLPPAKYEESNEGTSFKCVCTFMDYATEGRGHSKKAARHESARIMVKKFNDDKFLEKPENLLSITCPPLDKNVIGQLFEYCVANNVTRPLYSEKIKEGENFVIECKIDENVYLGKNKNKKQAKVEAAKKMSESMNIHLYFDDIAKVKERKVGMKNPVSKLREMCSQKKFNEVYEDTKIPEGYLVKCKLNDFVTTGTASSKPLAKADAAESMLDYITGLSTAKGRPTMEDSFSAEDSVNLNNTAASESGKSAPNLDESLTGNVETQDLKSECTDMSTNEGLINGNSKRRKSDINDSYSGSDSAFEENVSPGSTALKQKKRRK